MSSAVDETTGSSFHFPRDPVEIWLARQWQDVLGFGIGIRENFFGVGGNSLDAARVIDAVLVEFGVQLPLNVLSECPTVELLARLLRGHGERLSGPLVVIQDGAGGRPPLFLVHPGSGQVGGYCQVAHALGEEYPVSGLQAAGLYSDAEPCGSVAGMAAVYAEAVRAACPAGPYLLGGCGVGAAVAWEMAAGLGDAGLVAVIGEGLLEPGDAVTGSWAGEPPAAGDLPGILAGWQEQGLVPPDAAPEFAARSLRVWQAGQDAVRGWQPSPYPGPVDVFGQVPAGIVPAAAVQRAHPCSTAEQLASALRELLG